MITGPIRSKVDALWDAFWSGGISNPLEVIEQPFEPRALPWAEEYRAVGASVSCDAAAQRAAIPQPSPTGWVCIPQIEAA